MPLLALLESSGLSLTRVASTNGGEYAGPCPKCNGKDRFRVWPGKGRYWCRQCGITGDSIQYLRELKGMGYRQACNYLTIDPKPYAKAKPTCLVKGFVPKRYEPPTDKWQKQAEHLIARSEHSLLSEAGVSTHQWLRKSRGLSDNNIKQARLGWNPSNRYEDRSIWGLPSEKTDSGKEKRIWLPQGLVIPCLVNGSPSRIRFRRPNPKMGGRYIVVSASKMSPMCWNTKKRMAVVVESELDGLLIYQEAGDLVDVIALGFAQARPDECTHKALYRAKTFLVALDYDSAGLTHYKRFWVKTYPRAKRWPVPAGKDPGEAYQSGIDIRAWVQAGIDNDKEMCK
jgi:DNA primase